MKIFPQKWEIWLGNFDKIKEFSKDFRPVLILSSNIQNEFSEKVIVAPFSTDLSLINDKFEVFVKKAKENGLDKDSKILINSLFAIEKNLRLKSRLGSINSINHFCSQ
jgi:mRNA-degrading endonuclease toxin of MazEF toxin-antitoxin module